MAVRINENLVKSSEKTNIVALLIAKLRRYFFGIIAKQANNCLGHRLNLAKSAACFGYPPSRCALVD
jgi:hypothetical protein